MSIMIDIKIFVCFLRIFNAILMLINIGIVQLFETIPVFSSFLSYPKIRILQLNI